MPDAFSLSSTDTIIRSPALNAPSSQSASPKRTESCFSRSQTRSFTRGRRSLLQGLSPSRILAVTSSRIGGSTVLSAANIHVIARDLALAPSGSRPAWRSAIWNTIAPVSNRARSGEYMMYVLGFETHNMSTPDTMTSSLTNMAILFWIEDYCRANASANFADGTAARAEHLYAGRQRTGPPKH